MVELTDINKVMMLNAELGSIEQALTLLAAGATIKNMTLSSESVPWRFVNVNTSNMTYPSGMVEAIKSFLAQREADIRKQLEEFGVTGVAA